MKKTVFCILVVLLAMLMFVGCKKSGTNNGNGAGNAGQKIESDKKSNGLNVAGSDENKDNKDDNVLTNDDTTDKKGDSDSKNNSNEGENVDDASSKLDD